MLTSNNTPVYVKPTILPHTAAATVGGLGLLHDTAGSSGSTWAFTVERSSHTQLLDERRLSLGVSATGSILWSSAGTPEALFGLSARAILGQNLTNIIDVFADYLKGVLTNRHAYDSNSTAACRDTRFAVNQHSRCMLIHPATCHYSPPSHHHSLCSNLQMMQALTCRQRWQRWSTAARPSLAPPGELVWASLQLLTRPRLRTRLQQLRLPLLLRSASCCVRPPASRRPSLL